MSEYDSNVHYISPGFNLFKMVDPFMKKRLTMMLYKKYHAKYDRSPNNEAMQTIIINKISDMFETYDEYYKFRQDLAKSINVQWEIINPVNSFVEENLNLDEDRKRGYYEKKAIEILYDQGDWFYYVAKTLTNIDTKALSKLINEEINDILNDPAFKVSKELMKKNIKADENVSAVIYSYINEHKEDLKREEIYQDNISHILSYLSKAIRIELKHLSRFVAFIMTAYISQNNIKITDKIYESCIKCADYYVGNIFDIERQIENINSDIEMADRIGKLSFIKTNSFRLNEIVNDLIESKNKIRCDRETLMHDALESAGIRNLIANEDELFHMLNNEAEMDLFLVRPVELYTLTKKIASLAHLYRYDLQNSLRKILLHSPSNENRIILDFVLRPIINIEFMIGENSMYYGGIDLQLMIEINKNFTLERLNLLTDEKHVIKSLLDSVLEKYERLITGEAEAQNESSINAKFHQIYEAFKNSNAEECKMLILELDQEEIAKFKIFRQKRYDYFQSVRSRYLSLQSDWDKNKNIRNVFEGGSSKQDKDFDDLVGSQDTVLKDISSDIPAKLHKFVTEITADPRKYTLNEINSKFARFVSDVAGLKDDDFNIADIPDAESFKAMSLDERMTVYHKISHDIEKAIESVKRGTNRRKIIHEIADEIEKTESERLSLKLQDINKYIICENEMTAMLEKLRLEQNET